MLADCAEEFRAGDCVSFEALVNETDEILGHNAVLHRIEDCLFELIRKCCKLGNIIKLTPLAERAGPCKDGRGGVGAGGFALEVSVIMLDRKSVV